MGLELVEIVMDVEAAFGVQFPSSDWEDERARTVGGLFDKLMEKLNSPSVPSGMCVRTFVFQRLRRELVESRAIDRKRIRPSATINDLVPRAHRIETWDELTARTGFRLPRLRGSGTWFALQVILPIGAAYGTWKYSPPEVAVVLALAALIVTNLAIQVRTRFCRGLSRWLHRLPKNCRTVRDLVEQVVAMNQGSLLGGSGVWNYESAWKRFQDIVVTTLAVRPEEVTREARWKEDLAC
jgi:acyl carrier protein